MRLQPYLINQLEIYLMALIKIEYQIQFLQAEYALY